MAQCHKGGGCGWKINYLQVNLDHEVAVQSRQERKLEQLRGKSWERQTLQLSCWTLGGVREELGVVEEGL